MRLLMAVKTSSLANSSGISKWVKFSAFISSSSCINHVENFRDQLGKSEFEQKIQSLRSSLIPENLIRVLETTNDLSSAVKIFKWASLQNCFYHTSDTYFRIILKLGLAERVQEMEALCQDMVKDKCHGVEDAFVALIYTFVRHGRLSEAMRVLATMNLGGLKPSADIFNILLDALVKENRDIHDVLFVYKELVKAGVLPTIDTLNCLLEALLVNNHVQLALDQYRRISKKSCIANSRTFEILVRGLIAKGQLDEAISVLREMEELKCEPDMSFYTCAIPLFCRENEVEQAVRLFKMMRASNFVPDAFTCGILVQCMCKNLQLDIAVKLLDEMIEIGASLDDHLLVDIVNCFCSLGNLDEAAHFLDNKNFLKTPPYNVLLSSYCNAGNILAATILLEHMLKNNVADSHSCNIVIRWLCENKGIMKALQLLCRMIVFSFIVDDVTYSALVIGKCRINRYQDALRLFDHACSKCWVLDPMSYSELVQGLCQVNNKTEEAACVFYNMSMSRIPLDSFSLYVLVRRMCDAGQSNEAIRLRRLAYSSGTYSSIKTYVSIMHSLSNGEKLKNVLALLGQMLVEGCNIDLEVYCILIQSTIEQNQINKCVFYFTNMINDGLLPDAEKLLHYLSFISKHTKLSMVLRAIDKLCNSGIETPEMYNFLINRLWKEGHEREASQILDMMLEKGWLPEPSTHKLLIGSEESRETGSEISSSHDSSLQDSIGNILAESFGITPTAHVENLE